MMRRNYVTIFLFFSISFSTENSQQIQNSLIKNEIVPKIFQTSLTTPSFKLYDFLIYPSHDAFKYTILPFLSSSENLLKCFFYFQKLHPTLNLEKFLPYSTIKKDVLDLQNSGFVHIFQDEYQCFNPILYLENNYKICKMNDKNIKEDSICALFPTNKIFFLETHVLPNTREAYAAFDNQDKMFFVAIKTNQDDKKLTPIAIGIIEPQKFPHYLDCILDAHNLTGFSRLYFKIYNFYDTTYFDFVGKCILRGLAQLYLTVLKKISNVYLECFLFLFFFILGGIPFYHAIMLPFHIVSIPFEILFQNDCSWIFPRNAKLFFPSNFINFWLFPFFFYSVFKLCFARLLDLNNQITCDIRPQKTMWVVKYLLGKKQTDLFDSLMIIIFFLCGIFFLGMGFSLPFLPLFMMNGESYNE